jgi:arabinogalactan oligomer/maltooligosaccharide transport system permease protein
VIVNRNGQIKEGVQLGASYAFLIFYSLLIFLPVLWIIASSFKAGSTLFSTSFFPREFSTVHYRILLQETNFPIWYRNTLVVALFNSMASVILTSLTAYVFSRFSFRGKRLGMMTMLVLQMFPSFLAMVAIYVILLKLGLLDSIWGLLLVYVSGQIPFNTWICKGYMDGISRSLDESARVAGASNFAIFFRIILPLSKPVLVLVAINNFITPWFDFIFPALILRSPEKMTLAVGIFNWIYEQANENFTLFAAASMLVALPITLLFLFLQRYIALGITAGAVKG